MRVLLFSLLVLSLFAGCPSPEPVPEVQRQPVTLEELEIVVGEPVRQYVLSDKGGGFLVGEAGTAGDPFAPVWSIGGKEILRGFRLSRDGQEIDAGSFTTGSVLPHEIRLTASDGTTLTLMLPDRSGRDVHALVLMVRSASAAVMHLRPVPSPGFGPGKPSGNALTYRSRTGEDILVVFGGEGGTPSGDGIVVAGTRDATFLFLRGSGANATSAAALSRALPELREERRTRMENFVNRSYIRTSDERLNRSLAWAKLSLDALIVEGRDTFAVAGLPWNGSVDGRDNAQSIAGIGLATGDYATTGAILRTLARRQDTVASRSTYGRVPDLIRNETPRYAAADVTPWLIREMYEHVTYAHDTAMVRALYPVVQRAMTGTLQYHTDSLNLLVHGPHETWMNADGKGPARGNRAAEVQLLWYFQQLISSFVALHLGDTAAATRYDSLAGVTSEQFNSMFVDTTRLLLYDHLMPDGTGIVEMRPNALLCLEVIWFENVQQNMIRTLFRNLVYPHGVGTLARGDKRFTSHDPGSRPGALFDGPVFTWLTGQLTYTLTRYDRQDTAYLLTEQLIHRILEKGMAGTLPQVLEVAPRPGHSEPRGAGMQASLTGLAEFVRVVYQDYLGVRIDAPSNRISLHPKLPDHMQSVDFTVFSGLYPIHIRYEKGEGLSRIIVEAPDIPAPMKLGFLWMMEKGDVWRGTADLLPATRTTVVFGEKDVLLYTGRQEADLVSIQKLVNFSLRKELSGLQFADPAGTP